MAEDINHGKQPAIQDVAGLLRALFTDAANAGKIKVGTSDAAAGIAVIRQPANAQALNNDTQALSVTSIALNAVPPAGKKAPTRHIYRLNGVELSAPAKPMRGEIYMVELGGSLPSATTDMSADALAKAGGRILLQESNDGSLRPVGCPMVSKMDTPAFIPWFTTHNLTPYSLCAFSPHSLNVVLTPDDGDVFSTVYFAYIDAPSLAAIPTARLRILRD